MADRSGGPRDVPPPSPLGISLGLESPKDTGHTSPLQTLRLSRPPHDVSRRPTGRPGAAVVVGGVHGRLDEARVITLHSRGVGAVRVRPYSAEGGTCRSLRPSDRRPRRMGGRGGEGRGRPRELQGGGTTGPWTTESRIGWWERWIGAPSVSFDGAG